MYTHRNASLSRAADSLGHFLSPPDASTASPMQYSPAAAAAAAPPPLHHHHHGEFDSLLELNYSEMSSNNTYNSCSSGCTSYMGSPSSLASNYESRRVVQRSVSSHSLQKNGGTHHHPFSEFSPLFAEFIDSENGPVRRACSTGDLQVPSYYYYYYYPVIINTLYYVSLLVLNCCCVSQNASITDNCGRIRFTWLQLWLCYGCGPLFKTHGLTIRYYTPMILHHMLLDNFLLFILDSSW